MSGIYCYCFLIQIFSPLSIQIRSNTSQLLDEAIPLIKAKVIEMNSIYTKVDKLEVCYHTK